MKLTVHIRCEHGAVQAYCPDLPGCSASAPTEGQALVRLRERIEKYFAADHRSVLPGTRVTKLEV